LSDRHQPWESSISLDGEKTVPGLAPRVLFPFAVRRVSYLLDGRVIPSSTQIKDVPRANLYQDTAASLQGEPKLLKPPQWRVREQPVTPPARVPCPTAVERMKCNIALSRILYTQRSIGNEDSTVQLRGKRRPIVDHFLKDGKKEREEESKGFE
jgi:hypothetical protein